MITKQTIKVTDVEGNARDLELTVLEDESELHAIEEPPEPVITMTCEAGQWIVWGDDNANHPDFEETWFPRGLEKFEDVAEQYAKDWAKAVRGVWERI